MNKRYVEYKGVPFMRRLVLLLLSAFILAPFTAFGQAKVGTTGLQFLKVGVGARAFGMGGAFTSVANDASALHYNPAGLIQLKRPEATFSMIDYPAEIKFVYLGAAVPVSRTSGVVGIQVTSLFTDDMIETTPEMPYGTGRDFSAGDIATGVTYCQRLTDKFSVGGSLKYLNERLADKSASGWSADVGTFYSTGWREISIGMVIQNFGPDMKFVSSSFPLPITFKFGASMMAFESDYYSLLFASEFIHPNDNLELYKFGLEFTALKMISFRVGRQVNGWVRDEWEEYIEDSQQDPFLEYPLFEKEDGKTKISLDGFSAGLGLSIPQAGVSIDYAIGRMGTLGVVHRFSIGYSLSNILF